MSRYHYPGGADERKEPAGHGTARHGPAGYGAAGDYGPAGYAAPDGYRDSAGSRARAGYVPGEHGYPAVAGQSQATLTRERPGEIRDGRGRRRRAGTGPAKNRRPAGNRGPAANGAPGGRGRHPRQAGKGRRPSGRRGRLAVLGHRPVLAIIAITATVAVIGITLTAYAAWRNVYDSIHHVNVTNAMLGKRPPKLNGATNILVIGSDSRAGSHGKYGRGIAGSRSDTSMVLHISPTHNHVFVISFPRDSMVPIYQCEPDGQGHPGQQAQQGLERLNATFSDGGAPCLWKTLEQTTHIHIDHFIEVDFSGFQKIVNDVGGVKVCLPFAIHDPASKLSLPKGVHVIGGAQALAFVRERHVGLGSDLQRIQRQQYFLASVAQKIKSSGILGDPPKLYTLVHDIASALTTDTGLSPLELYGIASSLRNLSTGSLRFISVPVVPYPADPGAEVQWAPPAAGRLFRAIAEDSRILKTAHRAVRAVAPKAIPTPTISPSQVQVEVLNGTSTTGLAASTASKLTAKGFSVTATGNATTATYTASVIEYSSASQLPAVSTLKNEIAGAQVKQVPGLAPGSLTLILGSSFKGVGSPAGKTGQPPATTLANNYGGISGNTNICKDSGAFAGPDTPSVFGG